MKQKFFTTLLCLAPMLGFSQAYTQATGDIVANTGTGADGLMTPALTVSGDDMVVALGSMPPGHPEAPVTEMENLEEKIKVYPNPLGECIYVEAGFAVAGTMQCILYDASGRQLMNMSFSAERGQARRIISAARLAPGTYFLHTMYNNGDISSGTIFTINRSGAGRQP
ncbi:MAG: Secretion system C-terminal sorting domain [Flavipsychrobacter sp.]|jgi:hypothetical protein|nr:Secretion system C-terminal sorting domain [Flavipsychrobacter sp.]